MAILRRGDTLPSIRDIEKQTGVHRSQIHKACPALNQSGLLAPERGKRIRNSPYDYYISGPADRRLAGSAILGSRIFVF